MKAVFMGTPELAVPTLRALAADVEVSCVVTQPDRRAGRGRHLRPPPVKVVAEELGLPVWQPGSLRRHADDPRLVDCDLLVVFAYGEILSEAILARPRIAPINLHCSLLPRWRGASPMQAALRAGDHQTGISIQRMVRALDAGPVYCRHRLPLPVRTTLPELHDKLAVLGALAMGRFLRDLPLLEPMPQDPERVTWCGKLTHEDGHIDWRQDADAVERQVRAYTPAPGCWTRSGAQRIGIRAVRVLTDVHLPPGRTAQRGREILVGCGYGGVSLERLQPAGKRPMSARSYLNGHPLPEAFDLPVG